MTADTQVRSQVSELLKAQIEENCGLDMNSYQDLPKVGADCNGIKHVVKEEDGVNGNGRDDPDCSYVFVSGTDEVNCDPIDKENDLNAECSEKSNLLPMSNVGSPNKDISVQVAELNVGNGEFVRSSSDENNCTVDETDFVPSTDDVALEGSLGKSDGEGVAVDIARVNTVEERNGTAIVEHESQKLDCEVKVADGIELSESTPNPKENQESHVTVMDSAAQLGEAREPINMSLEPGEPRDVSVESQEQTNLHSTAELEESQISQNVVVEGAGCEDSSGVEVGEVKSKEQTILESASEVEESPESQNIITKSVEPWSCQLDNGEETLEEITEPDQDKIHESARELEESMRSQTVITTSVDSGSYQLDNGEKLETKNKTDLDSDVLARELEESSESQTIITTSVESGTYQLDKGEKLEVKNKTDLDLDSDESTRELEETSESQTIITTSVDSGSNQLDNGEKPETKNKTDLDSDESAREKEESKESQTIITTCAESGSHQLDNGEKFEAKNKTDLDSDESATELEESSESKTIITTSVESGSHQLDNMEKLEVKNNTDLDSDESARELEENSESQIKITKSVESGYCQLDNGEEKHYEKNNTDLDTDESAVEAEESLETQFNISNSAEYGSHQLDRGEEELEEKNKTVFVTDVEDNQESQTVVTASDENKVSQMKELSKCIDGTEKSPELNGNPESSESLPSPAYCEGSDGKVGYVPVESGGSFPDGPNGTIVEQEVGYGASLITEEKLPTCAVDDVHTETEVDLDVKNRESVISCPSDNAISEFEVKDGPVGGDSTSSHPANSVSSETEIPFGSIDNEEKALTFRCDDVHVDSEVSNGDIECALRQPTSANNLDPEYHVYDSLQNWCAADGKSESEVKNSSAISTGDMTSNDDAVSGSEVWVGTVVHSESTVNTLLEIVDVENVGDHASADAMDGESVGTEALTRPFHFLIRIPRFDDDKLREQIRHAQLQVDEKTQQRDAIRVEMQIKRANCQAHRDRYDVAKSEERAARRLVKLKRQEIDSVQSVINRVKNAISVEDIDGRIYNMEHMIEHETLPLKEEKQFIREIKQLKHLREQLSSNMGSQDEVQQALNQRDQIEERLKILKKELDCLKDGVSKAAAAAVAAGKKYDDESKKLKELQAQFGDADDVRQKAYTDLLSLKRHLYEKKFYFRMYKNDLMEASDYAMRGDREAVYRLCLGQVKNIMELWNKNDEFRKEYVRCNMRSTVRRLRTLDGRSLGPDEEPPVLPSYVDERVDRLVSSPGKANSISLVTIMDQEIQMSPVEGETDSKSIENVAVQNNLMVKTETTRKPILGSGSATVSGRDFTGGTKNEASVETKEEQELTRKVEELRKEEVEAKLKEQRRLEEKAKAKEALERKKRNAEKAQIRADLRAQKEEEQKEKEREKRLRKKERKKTAAPEAHDGNNDGETAASSGVPTESTKETEIKESTTALTKRPQKPSYFTKQSKPKSIPPPLRNRGGKRRMQQWMWAILASLLVLALFLLGNSGFFLTLQMRRVGF